MSEDLDAAMAELEQERLRVALNLSESEFEKFLAIRETYNPDLHDVNVILDDMLVGEYETRMSLFTIYILSEISSYVSGPSAAGKTAVMVLLLRVVPRCSMRLRM